MLGVGAAMYKYGNANVVGVVSIVPVDVASIVPAIIGLASRYHASNATVQAAIKAGSKYWQEVLDAAIDLKGAGGSRAGRVVNMAEEYLVVSISSLHRGDGTPFAFVITSDGRANQRVHGTRLEAVLNLLGRERWVLRTLTERDGDLEAILSRPVVVATAKPSRLQRKTPLDTNIGDT
jgi:hypothetical protein